VSQTVDVVYRGPFQGRRIRFLLDALDELGGRQRLFWVDPDPDDKSASRSFQSFADERANVISAAHLDGRPHGAPGAIRQLRRADPSSMVLAVGFTSLFWARVRRGERLVWAVNGIPEERLLYHDTARHRAVVRSMWSLARVGRTPDAAITVSHPMARLLEERIGSMTTFVAPTVVDRSTFRPRPPGPGRLTYMGSGAPWQDLPLLAEVWRAVHALDPALRFRVVSKDPRAEVLARAVPSEVVEVVEARGPAAVAAQLRDSQLGFIVRRRHVVNEVSYPTKFGEYVASGVGVVTTGIGWDIGSLVERTGCGVVLDVDSPPEAMAAAVVDLARRPEGAGRSLLDACDEAAASLDRSLWVKELGRSLAD
jgi:Glycosyl transferases group 1